MWVRPPAARCCIVVVLSMLMATCASVELTVCVTNMTLATQIQNLSSCLSYTGSQVLSGVSPTATSSASLCALAFNATQHKLTTYTLNRWAQTVLLSYVRSLVSRKGMYVKLNTATVSNNQISIANTTTGNWWVMDLGAAYVNNTLIGQTDQITISGYLSTVAATQSMMFGTKSLIMDPEYGEMSTVVNALSQQAQLAIVTFPSSGSFAFYGAVYPIPGSSLMASQIVAIASEALQNRPSANQKNNLHFQLIAAIAANGSLTNFSYVRSTFTDLALSDTPVPTTLTGGVTAAPITDSVIGWYIYLIIGIGVVCAVGFFFWLAKKARLKKEDKKKTAKRRKKDQDRFDKMAGDLRSGIEHDEDDREMESGKEDKNYY